jgi:multiple sugar transport system permease protein
VALARTPTRTAAGRPPGGRRRLIQALEGYLFVSPWLIGFLAFTTIPMAVSLYLSLTQWDIISPARFVGLRNYLELFGQDRLFWQSLKVTAIYTVFSVPLRIAVALLAAVLLARPIRGNSFFRTILYTPEVVAGVALALLWSWIFNPEFGLMNAGLRTFGVDGPGWIYTRQWALPALILMSTWKIGGNMIIYLAALQSIPRELYEAASLDGAGAWSKFWNVTLPMLSPAVFFTLVLGAITSLQVFTEAYVMTRGGPGDATMFYALYLYMAAFEFREMGYASAMAWILFVITLAMTLFIFGTARRWVYYEGA